MWVSLHVASVYLMGYDVAQYSIYITEREMSSGWLSWSSLETLKLAFNEKSDEQGSHPDDHYRLCDCVTMNNQHTIMSLPRCFIIMMTSSNGNISALLAIWPFVRGIHRSGEFPTQRPVTRSCDVFFDLRPNKRLSKQWWGWWFETPSGPLWRHCNVILDGVMIGAINFGGGHTGYFPNSRHWYCRNLNVPNEI